MEPRPFLEVYVATPVEVCRSRDPKGLYAKADRGELAHFTGVSAPYEAPASPDVVVHTQTEPLPSSIRRIVDHWKALTAKNPGRGSAE